MRIYTKTGDDGTTGLFGGMRLPKDGARVEAYGTIDELNSVLGLARAEALPNLIDQVLGQVQEDLFSLGAELACAPGKESNLPCATIDRDQVSRLETTIDEHELELAPLKNFILPGGSRAGALLHFARTVCRRAERCTVAARHDAPIRDVLVIYLNRLGDLLFVLARRTNQLAGLSDIPWAPRGS